MNTIHDLFSNYGWKQIKQQDNKQYNNTEYNNIEYNNTEYNNQLTKYIYIKKDGFNEFIIEPTIDDTYTISVPLLNSDYLYKNTINNIQDAITYIQMHLENLSTNI